MAKLFDEEGKEVEAFLPDEVNAKVTEAVTAKEAEFTPKIKTLEEELGGAKKALGERANQFAQLRKLTDEQVAKLSEAERVIYENGVALAKKDEERAEADKKAREATVDAVIRGKAGTDEKLFAKMKDMWGVIGIDAVTPEQMEQKTKMIMGAISQTEPDLLASVAGWSGGSFQPPVTKEKKEGESFATTEKGKTIADDLGLALDQDAAKKKLNIK